MTSFDDEFAVKTVSKCFAHMKGPNIQSVERYYGLLRYGDSQFTFFGKLVLWGNFPIAMPCHVRTMAIH